MPFEYNTPRIFEWKVRNFPEESYRVTDMSTRLFKYMWVLLELGVGALPVLQEVNNNTIDISNIYDLDNMFGYLGIYRLPEEMYTYDAYQQALPLPQWHDLITKDSMFRMRIIRFAQAVMRGGTPEGLQMMAEAATGRPCYILEVWRDSSNPDARLGTDNEFIVYPTVALTPNQKMSAYHMLDLLKPVNTLSTVIEEGTSNILAEIRPLWAAATSNFYEDARIITTDDTYDYAAMSGWMPPAGMPIPAPRYALLDTMDYQWSYNEDITNATANVIKADYVKRIGTLADNVNDNNPFLSVTEEIPTTIPVFNIKIGNEIMTVIDRDLVNNIWQYEVLRGQMGTTAAAHNINDIISTNFVDVDTDTTVTNPTWTVWMDIPLADSPDNYPKGQYVGDPYKYDYNGDYLFEWSSQSAFEDQFRETIAVLGGQIRIVSNRLQYRLPRSTETTITENTTPWDAIAPFDVIITSSVYPRL